MVTVVFKAKNPQPTKSEGVLMFTIKPTLSKTIQWIEAQWANLTEPVKKGLDGLKIPLGAEIASRWEESAFRLFLSQRSLALARIFNQAVPPIQPAMPEGLEIYNEAGQLQRLPRADQSDAWRQPSQPQGHFTAPAFRLSISQTGQLAGGAMASAYAPPEQMDRFVAHIRTGRQIGLYQAEIFQQARALLRKPVLTQNN